MSALPSTAKINKLLMQLILKAAKGDKDAVFQIAQKIVEEFEKGLEREEKDAGKD